MTISDRQLDRLRLGELDPAEAKELMTQLEAAGELHRLDDLMTAADAYLDRYPSRPAAQQIRDAARRRQREPSSAPRPWLTPARVLSLTALAVALLVAVWHSRPAPPTTPTRIVADTAAPAAARSEPPQVVPMIDEPSAGKDTDDMQIQLDAEAETDLRSPDPPNVTEEKVPAEPMQSPALADRFYKQAIKALLRGDYEEAIAAGELGVAAGCTSKCYRVVGMTHYKLGSPIKACEWLRKAGSELPAGLDCD